LQTLEIDSPRKGMKRAHPRQSRNLPPKVKGAALAGALPTAPTAPNVAEAVVEGGERVAAIAGFEPNVNPAVALLAAAVALCAAATLLPGADDWPKVKMLLPTESLPGLVKRDVVGAIPCQHHAQMCGVLPCWWHGSNTKCGERSPIHQTHEVQTLPARVKSL